MILDSHALDAAVSALGEEMRAAARDQSGYLHTFPDGRVSLELEWIDPVQRVRSAILAYVAEAQARQ